MLVPPAHHRTAPPGFDEWLAAFHEWRLAWEDRMSACEQVLAALLLQIGQRTAPATTRRMPKAQLREANMQRVGALRLEHPDWPMRLIAEKCNLKLDYCNQLWRDYRAAQGITTMR